MQDVSAFNANGSTPFACQFWERAERFEGLWLGLRKDNKGIVALNDSGRILWDALGSERSLQEVVSRCELELATDRATVESALKDLLVQCEQFGLLQKQVAQGRYRQLEPKMVPVFTDTIVVNGRAIRTSTNSAPFARLLAEVIAGFDRARAAPTDFVSVIERSDGQLTVAANGYCDQISPTMGHARAVVVNLLLQMGAGKDCLTARLHSACLIAPNGECVVLCGDGGRGKSTLAYTLVRTGWQLVSEDIIPLDAELRAVPLPFPISIKRGAWPLVIANNPEFEGCDSYQFGERVVKYFPVERSKIASRPARPDIFVHVNWGEENSYRAVRVTPMDTFTQYLSDESIFDFKKASFADLLTLLRDAKHISISYRKSADAISAIERALAK